MTPSAPLSVSELLLLANCQTVSEDDPVLILAWDPALVIFAPHPLPLPVGPQPFGPPPPLPVPQAYMENLLLRSAQARLKLSEPGTSIVQYDTRAAAEFAVASFLPVPAVAALLRGSRMAAGLPPMARDLRQVYAAGAGGALTVTTAAGFF